MEKIVDEFASSSAIVRVAIDIIVDRHSSFQMEPRESIPGFFNLETQEYVSVSLMQPLFHRGHASVLPDRPFYSLGRN